jgi:hypothetical protein
MEMLSTEKRDNSISPPGYKPAILAANGPLIYIFRQLGLKGALFHLVNTRQQAYLSPFPRTNGKVDETSPDPFTHYPKFKFQI